jgi:4-azaleucine resistance transporter AzlC
MNATLTQAAGRIELAALRDIVPLVVGLVPFAMVVGAATRQAGISLGVGVLGGVAMFSGTAQLAALTMLAAGTELLVILAAVVVINARFLIYGAALEPRFRDQPGWFRWLGPHLLTDEAYALVTNRADLGDPVRFRRYWLTVGAGLGTMWMVCTGAGVLLGALMPPSSPVSFVGTAVIIALLVPRIRVPRQVLIAVVALIVATAASGLPHGSGLMVGIAAGVAAGSLSEVRR